MANQKKTATTNKGTARCCSSKKSNSEVKSVGSTKSKTTNVRNSKTSATKSSVTK